MCVCDVSVFGDGRGGKQQDSQLVGEDVAIKKKVGVQYDSAGDDGGKTDRHRYVVGCLSDHKHRIL